MKKRFVAAKGHFLSGFKQMYNAQMQDACRGACMYSDNWQRLFSSLKEYHISFGIHLSTDGITDK